jgi:hypothetical protein
MASVVTEQPNKQPVGEYFAPSGCQAICKSHNIGLREFRPESGNQIMERYIDTTVVALLYKYIKVRNILHRFIY